MGLKKLGEKLKSSFHHLSPKSKKPEEACEGDLSPCNLPPKQERSPLPVSDEPNACNETTGCMPIKECQRSEPCGCATPQEPNAEAVKPQVTAQPATENEMACDLNTCPQPGAAQCAQQCACNGETTPRFDGNADIFPTMYYSVKANGEEPVQQSILLVNPSKSEKVFNLRLGGDCIADVEKDAMTIPGDWVERVTVTVKPEKEDNNVYIDLLEGGHLYDKIRVRAQPY